MNISLASHVPRICDKCGYKAPDLYDYDAHTRSDDCNANETHKIEARQNNCLQCNFCEEAFESRVKKEQTESVKVCWNFFSGKCGYGDEKCWFLHCKTSISRGHKAVTAGLLQTT